MPGASPISNICFSNSSVINIVESAELTVLQSMPKLHTVVINDSILSYELLIHLPWVQLTSLTINSIEESVFRFLMTQCTALETGYFSTGERDPEEQSAIDVTLERKKLSIFTSSTILIPQFLMVYTSQLSTTLCCSRNMDWSTPSRAHVPPAGAGHYVVAGGMYQVTLYDQYPP